MIYAMWLVVTDVKGNYVLHSAHQKEVDAKAWAQCKIHEGFDTHIVFVTKDMVIDLLPVVERVASGK